MNWDLTNTHNTQSKCGSCGMEKSGHKGCCKDKQKILKIEKDQKKSESFFQTISISSEATPWASIEWPSVHFLSIVKDNSFAHAPPQSGAVSIFLLNCHFRI